MLPERSLGGANRMKQELHKRPDTGLVTGKPEQIEARCDAPAEGIFQSCERTRHIAQHGGDTDGGV